jgi:formate hydrogenlyase subunit 3/multisubunit Na+/H+ antiporter MnhD subunit
LAALGLAICIFSLMGVPPTAGFFGKLYVFSAALSNGLTGDHGKAMVVLAVIGVLNSAIAAGDYLRIVAVCYLREPVAEPVAVERGHGIRLGLFACCLAVMVVGAWPEGLLKMSRLPFCDLGAPPAVAASASDAQKSPRRNRGHGEELRTGSRELRMAANRARSHSPQPPR